MFYFKITIFNFNTIGIQISNFEIRKFDEENLKIGSEASFLTLNSSGELKTTNINTETITTTNLDVKGYYFMLGNVMCQLADESEFNIDFITGKES